MPSVPFIASRKPGRRSAHWLLLTCALIMTGCAPITFKGGRDFDPLPLGTSLKAGRATMDEVRSILGAPSGEGRAQLPYHDSPRVVWTYFADRGEIQLPSDMKDERQYLFVYFDGERLDGWFWFDSRLSTAAK
jgi:hypothetical protein